MCGGHVRPGQLPELHHLPGRLQVPHGQCGPDCLHARHLQHRRPARLHGVPRWYVCLSGTPVPQPLARVHPPSVAITAIGEMAHPLVWPLSVWDRATDHAGCHRGDVCVRWTRRFGLSVDHAGHHQPVPGGSLRPGRLGQLHHLSRGLGVPLPDVQHRAVVRPRHLLVCRRGTSFAPPQLSVAVGASAWCTIRGGVGHSRVALAA